jgi:hypothetical protein
MPSSRFAEQIDAYLDGPKQLRRVVADLGPEQLKARPIAGKWSTGRLHRKSYSEQDFFEVGFVPTSGEAFVLDADLERGLVLQ